MSVPALCAEPPFLCYFIFTTASHFLGTVILSLSCQSAWKNDHILVILSRSPFLQAGSCQHCFPGSLQESLNQHIQWYPRSLRLIQQLGCQLQISLQTFLFIVPGTVSSLIFFLFFFFIFISFIFLFIVCMHAHIYHGTIKCSEESFLSPDCVCDFWGLNSDWQAWWQVPLLTEPSYPFLRFVFSYSSGLSCSPPETSHFWFFVPLAHPFWQALRLFCEHACLGSSLVLIPLTACPFDGTKPLVTGSFHPASPQKVFPTY